MSISTLKEGDKVYVFSREKDRYVKRPVFEDGSGKPYCTVPSATYWRGPVIIRLAGEGPASGDDVVTAEELPAAKKRHAARRKAEKAAEAERERRENDGKALAAALYEIGVGRLNYGERSPASVHRDGSIDVRLTVEQARVLLGALKGKV